MSTILSLNIFDRAQIINAFLLENWWKQKNLHIFTKFVAAKGLSLETPQVHLINTA